MKKVLFLIATLMALTCVTASAQADLPPFVQMAIDSCDGQPIAWGIAEYDGLEGSDTWFSFQNDDGLVFIWVDGVVPSDIRQNVQAIASDVKKKGWTTDTDYRAKQTLIGTAGYNILCKDDVCTNKKVTLVIQEKTKKTGLKLTVQEYFD